MRKQSNPLRVERLENRRLLAADVLMNPVEPLDVDNDQQVGLSDVRKVFAELVSPTSPLSTPAESTTERLYLDTNGDGALTIGDLRLPLSHVMGDQTSPVVEGVYVAPPATLAPTPVPELAGAPGMIVGRIDDTSGIVDVQLEYNDNVLSDVEIAEGGVFEIETGQFDASQLAIRATDVLGNETYVMADELVLPEGESAPATSAEGETGGLQLVVEPISTTVVPGEPLQLHIRVEGGVSPYDVTVDWGDGTVDHIPLSEPGDLTPAQVYLSPNIYEVSVSVIDDAENSLSWSETIGVTGYTIDDDNNVMVIGADGADFGGIVMMGDNYLVYGSSLNTQVVSLGSQSWGVASFGQFYIPINEFGSFTFYGLGGNDTFVNYTGASTTLFGGWGNDVLFGGWAVDQIYGEIGNDYAMGGRGNDMIDVGDGRDIGKGGGGNDWVWGGGGFNFLFGDRGDDTLGGWGSYNILNDLQGDNSFHGNENGVDFVFGSDTDSFTDFDSRDHLFTIPVRLSF